MIDLHDSILTILNWLVPIEANHFKIESGIAFARRREDEGRGTAKNVSSRAKKNFTGTEGQVEESQGSNEVTPSLF